MPRPRSGFGGVAGSDGLIYAFGGNSYTADVYDPVANTWAPLADMNSTRYGLSGALGPDGRIYAIGGSVSGVPPSPQTYQPTTGILIPTPTPPPHPVQPP